MEATNGCTTSNFDTLWNPVSRVHRWCGERFAVHEQLLPRRKASYVFEVALHCLYYVFGSLGSANRATNHENRLQHACEGSWFKVKHLPVPFVRTQFAWYVRCSNNEVWFECFDEGWLDMQPRAKLLSTRCI
jgi:hypothetical protein